MSRKNKMRMTDVVHVYADASYCSHTSAWGYGYCIKIGQPVMQRTHSGGGMHCMSSQYAELVAVREALDFLRVHLKGILQDVVVEVRSDCLGALAGIKHDAEEFKTLTGVRRVDLLHVQSHARGGDTHTVLNKLCDSLARQAMKRYRARVHAAREAKRNRRKAHA